ncbi:MAG: acyl carrier protein [Alphaproteobacteria bacterium]|nr:acyl carrier protein [Alphaproteobacteria bacterium]MBV9899629.1 acyl carrier protein [Alphaproteobacteria bacterium]
MDTHEVVTSIIEDLLNREDVEDDDNFFECGGNSLMAARALSLLGDRFGIELSLSAFFEHPTARGLVTLVEIALMHRSGATGAADDDQGYEDVLI